MSGQARAVSLGGRQRPASGGPSDPTSNAHLSRRPTKVATWFTGYLRSATSAEIAAQLMSTGATTALRVRGRWQLCRSSFRYLAVSVRETGIWEALRVLGRPDLKGLLRNDCGRKRQSLTSTPMSPVVSVEYINAFSRQERTHDQERLILHRLSTPVSCRCAPPTQHCAVATPAYDRGSWRRVGPCTPGRLPKGADRGRRLRAVRVRGLGRPGCSPPAAKDAAKSVQLSVANA